MGLIAVADPDLQIRGEGWSSRPLDKGGGGLKFFFFDLSGLSLVQK